MISKVIITNHAQELLDSYIGYVATFLDDKYAAKSILNDARNTRDLLLTTGESLVYCKDETLRKMGYHVARFKHHRYVYIYQVIDNVVFIEATYHELQDYENLFLQSLEN